jgi:hypothetical protein
MAKYKVLVIALSIKNNKIAKSGDIVDDTMLNTAANLLIENGFIKEVEEELQSEASEEVEETKEEALEEVKPAETKASKAKAKK